MFFHKKKEKDFQIVYIGLLNMIQIVMWLLVIMCLVHLKTMEPLWVFVAIWRILVIVQKQIEVQCMAVIL